ncbi:hypothetical protein PPYR_13137 [Photinus pyralis]|uniref:Vitellogenin domain-containing protein n=1 Tax=Photinus pyralis TaxID=7054 RepID=A0A1Y1M858_PHOPY|nr:microsomal triglyceride transfer protein large subunit [Photinus pyralis]XP_031353485.1 microsomal triglyceride transfer protein large subunit [Photinus pyralis]XP_031353486.1 microsomal triglyceride transfer protein large subunit [Photinus pyralis]KAB0793517.1 hypothetical protein PPYR_13137 [Photinus pyralis]
MKNFAIWYLSFSRSWWILYGFALVTSAKESLGFAENQIFRSGNSWTYDFRTSVLLSELQGSAKDVGFLIEGTVIIKSVWEGANLERLLQVELISPKLNIRSGHAPKPDGFMWHTSKLESFKNSPFLVHWTKGKIQKILLRKDEQLALINLKKGLASLLQFQTLDQEISEIDSSGQCDVKYTSLGPHSFTKTKVACSSSDLPSYSNPDPVLNTKVESNRIATYELGGDQGYLHSINLSEEHLMILNAKENVGNKVVIHQSLALTDSSTTDQLMGNTMDEVISNVMDKNVFTEESLLTEREFLHSEPMTFRSAVKESKSNLKSKAIGSLDSSKIIGRLVTIGRTSSKEDIMKTLGNKKNNAILNQLYDLLGIIQTDASHQAAMKQLFFDDKNHEERSERYLWSLSVSPQTNPEILSDLLRRYRKLANMPDKVKETLLLTIATMSYKLSTSPNFDKYYKIYEEAEETVVNGLSYAKDDERYASLRALKNLKSNTTIPKLLEVLKNGTDKERVLAWKALASFHPSQWNEEILSTAVTTFFQMDRKHDTSSRTLALDILLEANPSDCLLKRLIYFLTTKCKSFEVLQYLMQKLNMMSESSPDFKAKIQAIIRGDSMLNNYATLSERGLSTALKRNFLVSDASNGTLIAVQEIQSGIVKRGIVDVVLEKSDARQELLRLGIFTSGLASLISSETEGAESDEAATAGIELTIMGTQIRPFVFFNGQGELMGHVWSGTASEMTPAYQALLMPYNHLQYLRLAPGFICEMDLKGSASFDLSGKVEFSLWNRNGVSLIEKSAGLFVDGYIRLDTEFVKSQTEFTLLMEPKFSLQTDLNFSSSISLCMRLSQPDYVYRHNIYKSERVPGTKHQIRKSKYLRYVIPGKTYSLNKKNNDMCNLLKM